MGRECITELLGPNEVTSATDQRMVTSSKNNQARGSVVVSWTEGKDGCFACYKAILEGYGISSLLNFRDVKRNRSHQMNPELLSAQSRAIGILILQLDFVSYEDEFKKVIRTLNHNGAGIEGAVFGHIRTHKNLVDRICSDLGIKLILPIWNLASTQIITDFIDAGFETIVVSAKPDLLGNEWLGRKIDREFVTDLSSLQKGIDPCGEAGEYHSFVIGGPLFKNRIRIVKSNKVLKDEYWRLDILGYAIEE